MTRERYTLTTATAATASENVDFNVPGWAKTASFFLDLSAVAGTTPIFDCKLQWGNGTGEFIDVDGGAFAQLTAAGQQILQVGEGLTADSTGNILSTPRLLTSQMRLVTTVDRTTGNETYTYSITVEYSD